MSKRSIAITFVIVLFVLLAFSIVYVFTELYTESDIPIVKASESQKFKEEFEKFNNQAIDDITLKELDIPVNNPFLIKELKDINKLMKKKESFYVYFAAANNQKARYNLESLIESAQDNGVKKIYYVDITNDMDEYILDSKNKLSLSKEGSEEYKKALSYFEPILDNYDSLSYVTKKGKTKIVEINEKRIYNPVLIKVVEGVPIAKEYGIDNINEYNTEIKCSIVNKYDCLFKKESADPLVCDVKTMCN